MVKSRRAHRTSPRPLTPQCKQPNRHGRAWWPVIQEGTLRNADTMNLATSPNDAATIYVAGHDVFHSSQDGGQSWAPVQHNLPGTDIHGFA